MKRAGIDNPADYELVENRSKELKNLYMERYSNSTCKGWVYQKHKGTQTMDSHQRNFYLGVSYNR